MSELIDNEPRDESARSNFAPLDLIVRQVSVHWRGISASVIVGAIGLFVASYFMTPQYKANTVFVIVEGENKGGNLSGLVGQLGGLGGLAGMVLQGGGGTRDEYLAFVRSRSFIARFIEEDGLLPELYWKKWDAEKKQWRDSDPEGNPSVHDGVQKFRESVLSLSDDRRTGLVNLSITWRDPDTSAKWANLLVQRANRDLRQRAITEAQTSIDYLRGELAKTDDVNLQKSMYQIMEAQLRNVMFANVREQFALKIIDPAAVPLPQEKISPRRMVMTIVGGFLGGMLGLIVALVSVRRSELKVGH